MCFNGINMKESLVAANSRPRQLYLQHVAYGAPNLANFRRYCC